MTDNVSLIASVATLILFVFYFVGRIITILSVRPVWKDKVILRKMDYSQYEIVDEITQKEENNGIVYGILLSREGIRDLKIYSVVPSKQGLLTEQGELLYSRKFLNIDQAIAFQYDTGDLFPTLLIEYNTIDYMKVTIEWRDNLKNGVFSELIQPRHTIRSFFYYLLR